MPEVAIWHTGRRNREIGHRIGSGRAASVRRSGSGPALILLHAGLADRTMWREQLEPLAGAGYRVVAVDLPGFGEAPLPEGPLAPWQDVLNTMDALGIARAVLVGNSLGGQVALRVAAVAAERISALALISVPPPDLAPSPELKAAWEAEMSAFERGDIEAAVQAVVEAWTLPDAPPELREHVAQMQRRALVAHASAPEVPEAPDPLDSLALTTIELPVLVAVGEHDISDFRDGARRMAAQLPSARHVEIAGSRHLAPLETPEAFRELVLEFLTGPLDD